MNNITLLNEVAALAGYTISGGTGQDVINKARAQRRVNLVKADIISRYGGKWPALYQEGWLPLVPLYTTGTVDFTSSSRTVTGHGTVWTSSMKGGKILASDGAQYRIANVTNNTTLILTQPYQGTANQSLVAYQIWVDEYRLYPNVQMVGGFVDYQITGTASEAWAKNMKDSFSNQQGSELATVYTILGRKNTDVYNTGTLSGTVNTYIVTGVGTSWLSNIEPGYEVTISGTKYNVKCVNSDTELELYQQLISTYVIGTTYSAVGKNAITVRFRSPTSQKIVHYWYYSKDYPFVNDNDEDWVAEMYAEVIQNGAVRKDYLDKNDVARASLSKQEYEDAIRNMRAAVDNAYTGIRTIGLNIPPEARG